MALPERLFNPLHDLLVQPRPLDCFEHAIVSSAEPESRGPTTVPLAEKPCKKKLACWLVKLA
jgi:hypothetical protein